MNIADLYDDQRLRREAAESAGRQTAFLANAASVLATSPEYEQTLGAVVGLAVPDIADWCALDIVNDDGAIVRLAIAHVDPHKIELVRALEQRYPEDANTRGSVPYVIRTGLPALREHLAIEDLVAHARDDDHRRLLEQLAISSYMCVPLASSSGIFGAITFAFAESRRHYAPEDLRFAQDVATRASLAVENARAYRRTQEANRLKDEFLATLSHELRTPLNAILGYARMLQMRMLSGRDATQAVAVLTRNAEVLRKIIDDVLDVSRIVAGKLRLNVQPTALAAILKNAVATLRPAADAKGVALEVHASDTSTLVSGDPDRLQQIAWNLLSNAVKFTPRGGRVRATLQAADSFVDLTVTDTGQGIDPDFLPHVFERFRQADSRFSRDHGGLGLGLSIVRELVQLHGGTVQASSEGLGKGSTFAVRLPIVLRKIDGAGKRRAPTPRRGVERLAAAPRAIGASTRKGRR